jgi:hypothetical protein
MRRGSVEARRSSPGLWPGSTRELSLSSVHFLSSTRVGDTAVEGKWPWCWWCANYLSQLHTALHIQSRLDLSDPVMLDARY